MNDMTPTREQREAKLEGMGCKRKRVEDIRFTQGRGNYVDDVKLPGMLHGDFVRSPHAHARVKSINSEEALKVPGVLAVITAETLKTVNLAWMPTLAGDVQMVLADGKVLFQNQEVAFVVATDRYAADDGINKVVVEYEPLPVVIDPFKAMDADARCCARISPARPPARTARASIITTSSNGRSATRTSPTPRLKRRM
jgi:carbon-monoxide dehydrogenase large subunit